jgi:hypothetical protein
MKPETTPDAERHFWTGYALSLAAAFICGLAVGVCTLLQMGFHYAP